MSFGLVTFPVPGYGMIPGLRSSSRCSAVAWISSLIGPRFPLRSFQLQASPDRHHSLMADFGNLISLTRLKKVLCGCVTVHMYLPMYYCPAEGSSAKVGTVSMFEYLPIAVFTKKSVKRSTKTHGYVYGQCTWSPAMSYNKIFISR